MRHKFVGFQENFHSSRFYIFHLPIEMHHVLANTIDGSSNLPGNGSNSVAVPSHVCIDEGNFLETVAMPDSVEGHSKSIHAVGPNVARLSLGPAFAVRVVRVFPVPVAIFRRFVELDEFSLVSLCLILIKLNWLFLA